MMDRQPPGDSRAALRALVAGRGPGTGALQPRARLSTDAPELSLDGRWRFHHAPSIEAAPVGVEDESFDDTGWARTTVPSHWVLDGYGRPQYTNVRYPFPVDPPNVPDENGIGDYRRRFDTPAAFAGHRAHLRLDGADSSATVWLNGTFVGTTYGSRLTHEFDVTALLRDHDNVLVVRVAQWSAASYLEDQDMWWLPGLFRSVTLLARPYGGVDDLTVLADFDDDEQVGRLRVRAATEGDVPAVLDCRELGLHELPLPVDVSVPCAAWSAEVPKLYQVTVRTPAETVIESVGFRTIRVRDSQVTVNGVPVLFRGVNRHEHHARTGRVLSDADIMRDLVLMKQHNVNAIRTAHYPPDHRVLALADRLGFYVIEECDFETHGFVAVDWKDNPTDDPAWLPALLDRVTRTVARDRNHPSVVMWSIGNESGTGRNIEHMARTTRALDPTRLVHYERDHSAEHVDVYSRMYLVHAELDEIGRHAEPALDDPELDAHRRALPFILCEYAHAMGNSPGGLSEYQELFEKYPRLQGGFVWEWIEHGLQAVSLDGSAFYAYGGDFGEAVHDGNFVADGMVAPDRRPRPALLDFKKVIEPLRMSVDGAWTEVTLGNRFDFRSTRGVEIRWSIATAGGVVDSDALEVPAVAAGSDVRVDLPDRVRARLPASEPMVLTVTATERHASEWAPAGHEIAWTQSAAEPAPVVRASRPRPPRRAADVLRLGAAEFSPVDGSLRSIGGRSIGGPRLNLWRAPTDNDLGVRMLEFGGIRPDAAAWSAHHLDRLQSRVLGVRCEPDGIVVRIRSGPPSLGCHVVTEYRWTAAGPDLLLDVALEPVGRWDTTWARIGLDFVLDDDIDRVRWRGRGPGQAYPDTGQHTRLGWFDLAVDELGVDYLRPQENGARAGVRELALGSDASLTVRGEPFGFTLRRWTDQALHSAAHPYDLVPDGSLHLTIDIAQHGIGTGACGPGVLPAYRLQPRPASARFVLAAGGAPTT